MKLRVHCIRNQVAAHEDFEQPKDIPKETLDTIEPEVTASGDLVIYRHFANIHHEARRVMAGWARGQWFTFGWVD